MQVMTRARIGATVALMVMALSIGGCTSDNGGDGKTKTTPAQASAGGGELFVASASEGKLEAQDAKHEFTLTLGQAHDSVSVFSDRPRRQAGTESLADFVAAWDKRGFTKSPPNAAVVWGKDSSSRIFELSKPAYDASADTLVFAARDLGDEPSTALSSFEETPDAELPTDLGEVAVFIDNACLTKPGAPPTATAEFWFDLPQSGTATVTMTDQQMQYLSFSPGPLGTGKRLSPTSFQISCDKTTPAYPTCQIVAKFGGLAVTDENPNGATWPLRGTLETSPGVKVTVAYPYSNEGSLPAGRFTMVGWSVCEQ